VYRHAGSTPLKRIAPGTVLKHRTVHALASGTAKAHQADQ